MPKPGSTAARGYGRPHQATRKTWEPKVKAGLVDCWRCGQPIDPDQPWDLGHDDWDRTITHGPEHRHKRHCAAGGNRSLGAIKGNKSRAARRKPRRWTL